MRHTLIFVSGLILLMACGCKSTQDQPPAAGTPVATASASPAAASAVVTAASPTNVPPKAPGSPDACTLLTSDEIKTVQGEALKETKASQQAGRDFVIDICYYELPTPSNSVSLSLAQANPNKKDSVAKFWETTFGESEHGRKKKDREREGEGEIEEGAPARKISGLGKEAFWFSSPIGGVLYVLKGDHYIRISVGGKGTSEEKLNKSKALAKKAIARL